MIHDLLSNDDQLRFLVDPDVLECAGSEPFETLAAEMNAFAAFHDLSGADVVNLYMRFLRRHVANQGRFAKTGKYPFELDGAVADVPRLEYELALILSTLTTRPRHRVMELLYSGAGLEGASGLREGVIIGVGPGLENAMLKGRFDRLVGYDPHLSAFPARSGSSAELVAGFFDGTREGDEPRAYYAVEVLEHLPQPFSLLDVIVDSAAPGSIAVLTTIRDEPQFDHLYNFVPGEVERYACGRGLRVRFHERIPHKAVGHRSPAENEFFVLELPGR